MADHSHAQGHVDEKAYLVHTRPLEPFRVARITTYVLKAIPPEPVKTSFGVMGERPGVLVRLEDEDGAVGWGEAWCNFPAGGAAHRANLINKTLAPMIVGRKFEHPTDLYLMLAERLRILTIQTGEEGPFAQVIAALDVAAWDLSSRRLAEPLWRLFGGEHRSVPVYASGINPVEPEHIAAQALEKGFTAFKLKIGFDEQRDLRNLSALRDLLGFGRSLMADVNQAWTLDAALSRVKALQAYDLGWLEEPLAADSPKSWWHELNSRCGIPLAAGENIRGSVAFHDAIEDKTVHVLQPDLAKWGGFSGCLPVVREALRRGLRYCPHCLGGGVGLLASAHLLSAAGGDGMLEVDVNDNPLRTEIFGAELPLHGGRFIMSQSPGLGMVPEAAILDRYSG